MEPSSESTSESTRRALAKLQRDLGPLIVAALNDPTTREVMRNADGSVWHERAGHGIQRIGHLSDGQAEAVLRGVAGLVNKRVGRDSRILSAEVGPWHARLEGHLPPIAQSPTFTLRKPAVVAYRLADYVEAGSLSQAHCELLGNALAERRNILVVGGTGSGKTTLVNALLAELVERCPDDRLVLLEDTREIQCPAPNHLQLHTLPEEGVDLEQLLRSSLRCRPDRILVGEVRGPEALDLLNAWNTGHPGGIATVHADSAVAGLARLERMIERSPFAPRTPRDVVLESVDLALFIHKTPAGRRVSEVIRVKSPGHAQYPVETL